MWVQIVQNKAIYHVVTEIKHDSLYVFVLACVEDQSERKGSSVLPMW